MKTNQGSSNVCNMTLQHSGTYVTSIISVIYYKTMYYIGLFGDQWGRVHGMGGLAYGVPYLAYARGLCTLDPSSSTSRKKKKLKE